MEFIVWSSEFRRTLNYELRTKTKNYELRNSTVVLTAMNRRPLGAKKYYLFYKDELNFKVAIIVSRNEIMDATVLIRW